MRIFLLLLLTFSFNPPKEHKIELPEVVIVEKHIIYKGYGSETAQLFYKECENKIITAICLAEHGGQLPKNGNPGNIRYTKEYKVFNNWQEGLKELQKVLKGRRYIECWLKPKDQCIECIQKSGYSPSNEWPKRVKFWLNLIK